MVTTASDPQGRPTVIDLVPAEPRVFPVGRLDWDTEGLLVLTNDGDLAHGLTHPSRGVPKTYLAEVTGVPGRAALPPAPRGRRARRRPHRPGPGPPGPDHADRSGTRDRRSTRAATARSGGCWRRSGHPVRRLVRTRFGPLADRRLAPGQWRPFDQAEIRALYAAIQLNNNDAPDDGEV